MPENQTGNAENVAGHALVGPMTDSTDPRWHCICGEEISRSGWTADLNFRDHLTRVTSPGSGDTA